MATATAALAAPGRCPECKKLHAADAAPAGDGDADAVRASFKKGSAVCDAVLALCEPASHTFARGQRYDSSGGSLE